MKYKLHINENQLYKIISEAITNSAFNEIVGGATRACLKRKRNSSLTDIYREVINILNIKDDEMLSNLMFYAGVKDIDDLYDCIYNVVEQVYTDNIGLQQVSEDLTRGHIQDEIEDYTKGKDFEKRVHNIVVDALKELVDNMWTKKSFWTTMLKKK